MSRARNPMIVRAVQSRQAPVSDVSRDHLLRFNALFAERTGLSRDALRDHPLVDWIHPDDRAKLQRALDGCNEVFSARHRTADRDWVELHWQVKSFDSTLYALGSGAEFPANQPNTDRRETAADQLMGETLREAALIVEEQHPGLRCSILLLDEEQERVRVGAGPSLPASYNAAVEGLHIGPGVGSCGTAAFWNRRVIVDDIARDPLWVELRDHAASANVGACWSHPITDRGGSVLGALALYDAGPRTPTQSELDGLETAARIVGLAIERGRAEEALREAERRLHESAKADALGVLAGGVAHDFNNMLAAVMGNIELSRESLESSPAIARAHLDEAVLASQRASELCRQMLDYTGRGAWSTKPVELNQLVRELLGLLRPSLPASTKLLGDFEDQPLFVEADDTQLRQVVLNLVKNASEALEGEPGRVVVTTGIETVQAHPKAPPEARVRLTVRDSGRGIGPELRDRIFEPFFTTKPSGRGLGLAVTRGVVERHRGAIDLRSIEGEGTEFYVSLPRVPTPGDDFREGADLATARTARVLVVDDDPAVLRTFTTILERAHFEVFPANSGEEAVELARTLAGPIDCALLDLTMPRMSGEETYHALRSLEPGLEVVIATGCASEAVMERLGGLDLVDVLQKPVSSVDIVRAVSSACRKASNRRRG